jgi:hypothetical protein
MKRRVREYNQANARLTVERLSADSLDVGELKRLGMLTDDLRALRGSLRWPHIREIIADRYWIELQMV